MWRIQFQKQGRAWHQARRHYVESEDRSLYLEIQPLGRAFDTPKPAHCDTPSPINNTPPNSSHTVLPTGDKYANTGANGAITIQIIIPTYYILFYLPYYIVWYTN